MDILKAYTAKGKCCLVNQNSVVGNWTSEMNFEINLIFSLSLEDGNDLALLRNLRNIASAESLSIDCRIFAIYKFYELISELFTHNDANFPGGMNEIASMFFEISSILSEIKPGVHPRFFDLMQYIFQCCISQLYTNRHLDIEHLYLIRSAQENSELLKSRYILTEVPSKILDTLLSYKATDPSYVLAASLELLDFCKRKNLNTNDNFRYRFSSFLRMYTRDYMNEPGMFEEYNSFFHQMDHQFFNYKIYQQIAENYYAMCKRLKKRPEVEFYRMSSDDRSALEQKYQLNKITSMQFMEKGNAASESLQKGNMDQFMILSEKAVQLTKQYIGTPQHKEILTTGFKNIQAAVQRGHRGVSFKLYGSCQLETWTVFSNVDLTIIVENWWDIQASLAQIPDSCLERFNEVALKLTFNGCAFVITANDNIGALTSKLLKQYLSLNSKAPALVLFIKIWAKHQGLISPNGLSGFHITLLVIHFFQVKGLFPSLQTDEHEPVIVEGVDTWFNSNPVIKASENWSFGFLILMFFEHYAKDFYAQGKIHACDLKLGVLVEEPIDSLFAARHPFTNCVIGQKIKLGTPLANCIYGKFHEAYDLLIQGKDLIAEHLQA